MMSSFMIDEVAGIVRDAGGSVVGRTRLQKVAYLLTVTGLDGNFQFAYKHYGPFSEQLASSAQLATLVGKLRERQDQTAWGGTFSTYTVDGADVIDRTSNRYKLASEAVKADSIELELAATAVFLSYDGYDNAWEETARRKPEKSTQQRLANARGLLKRLQQIDVPVPLPKIR
jgi:uncharacterized protein